MLYLYLANLFMLKFPHMKEKCTSFIYSFIHLLVLVYHHSFTNRHVLGTFQKTDTVPGTGDSVMDKASSSPALMELTSKWGRWMKG